MLTHDPMVLVFYGGRRLGKTLSMTAQAVKMLYRGANVWANYNISFFVRDQDGTLTHYQSRPLDLEDILMMQRKDEIRDGVAMLDEWNLWCNSRRSGQNSNYIFNGVTQLIGKRNLSFYITTQSFTSLDKMIRFQCDLTIYCTDLHYRYRNIPKGYRISQYITDWSGYLTGRPILNDGDKYAQFRNSFTRILKGNKFHGCYDTGFEFDVLDVMTTKYSMDSEYRKIGTDGIVAKEADVNATRGKIGRMAGIYPTGTVFTKQEMEEMLAEEGLPTHRKGFVGQVMKESGFDYDRNYKGVITYKLNKREED